jgi:hypothetical protein
VNLKHPSGPPITAEECRREAQKCIDESAKAHVSYRVSSDWLVLAELGSGWPKS